MATKNSTMGSSFADMIRSDQFTFFVGDEKTPIVVHSAAIAAASEPLNSLINGRLNEAQTRSAEIKDVEVEDFIRFCEYAYRGDYTVPSPTSDGLPDEDMVKAELSEIQKLSSLVEETEPPEADDEWGSFGTTKKKKSKKSKKWKTPPIEEPDLPPDDPEIGAYGSEIGADDYPFGSTSISIKNKTVENQVTLRERFQSWNYSADPASYAQNNILEGFRPNGNQTANENFTTIFLAHARLYCFANQRLIEPLKALSLRKLHHTLLDFKLYHTRVGDIIELARYAYSNERTRDRYEAGNLDSLRQLVVEYMACEVDIIGKADAFLELLDEGGEFVGDFWGITRRYLIK